MPRKRSNSRKPQKQPDNPIRDVKELFDSLRPHIPVTVEQVCARLNPRPQSAELEDFVEEINLLLRENDFVRLRSFRGDSDPKTWLFSVAKNHIRKQFRRQSKMVSLDDLPPDAFVSKPDQETKMLLEEIENVALGDRSPLTPGEKKLFKLWRRGVSDRDISEILGIKIASVQSKKIQNVQKDTRQAGGKVNRAWEREIG